MLYFALNKMWFEIIENEFDFGIYCMTCGFDKYYMFEWWIWIKMFRIFYLKYDIMDLDGDYFVGLIMKFVMEAMDWS